MRFKNRKVFLRECLKLASQLEFKESFGCASGANKMLTHPLITTLKGLKGNPRAVVFTEPLWGIPYNLFIPYASIYMLALGVKDAQIGMITSLGMIIQVFFALISGAITDKFGRRWVTFISDILSWSIPVLIWAIAQNIWYFIIAAVFNAMWRIPANSWTCLMVEDADEDSLVHIWTWIYISAQLSAFFAPLAGLLVGSLELVPAVRLMYFFAFIMMTAKAWILFRYSTETDQGKIRMAETKQVPIFNLLKGYRGILKRILKTPRMVVILGLQFVFGVVWMVQGTFWSILVTERLGIPDEHLALFPFAKSALMLLLYFLVVPRINLKRFRNPMLLGIIGFITANILLVTIPPQNYGLLLLSVLIDALSIATFIPLVDSLAIISIDKEERARINSILSVVVITLTSPFGWIAGQLSEVNKTYPFILIIGLFVLGAVLVLLAWHFKDHRFSDELRS